MKYIVKNKNDFFIKGSDSKIKLIFSRNTEVHFFINSTAAYIFDICDKYSDTDQIVELISSKYPDIDKNIINRDISDLFSLLSIYGVVEIKDDKSNTTNIVAQPFAYVVGDKEYIEIERFIKSNFNKSNYGFVSATNPKYYDAINIRNHVMMNDEYYFGYRDILGKTIAVA